MIVWFFSSAALIVRIGIIGIIKFLSLVSVAIDFFLTAQLESGNVNIEMGSRICP